MTRLIDPISLSPDGILPTEFTAIGLRTSALGPGHITEISAVRMRADGSIVDEFTSLVDPGAGIGPGPLLGHRIRRSELDAAPLFADILGHILHLLGDSVLVAHNLPFVRRFLDAELAKLGVVVAPMPAVCTMAAAKRIVRLPNYRMDTVAAALGIAEFSALTAHDDAAQTARILSAMVNGHGLALERPPRFPHLPVWPTTNPPMPRSAGAPLAWSSWLGAIADRIRLPAEHSADPALEAAYYERLNHALADLRISAAALTELDTFAAAAGMPVADIARIRAGFGSAIRDLVHADGALSPADYQELTSLAATLGADELMRGLTVSTERPSRANVLVLGDTPAANELRAAILGNRIQLARWLSPSVTHLVAAAVPPSDPRCEAADKLGIPILTIPAARSALALAPDSHRFLHRLTETVPLNLQFCPGVGEH